MKRNKYGAVKQKIDGLTFDSKLEASRYLQLRVWELAGEISSLCIHTRWPLVVNGKLVANYVSDFDYIYLGERVIEDCKGVLTPLYRLKKKIFEANYGKQIKEVFAGKKR